MNAAAAVPRAAPRGTSRVGPARPVRVPDEPGGSGTRRALFPTRLGPELALRFLDLPDVAAALRVCAHWRRASEAVFREVARDFGLRKKENEWRDVVSSRFVSWRDVVRGHVSLRWVAAVENYQRELDPESGVGWPRNWPPRFVYDMGKFPDIGEARFENRTGGARGLLVVGSGRPLARRTSLRVHVAHEVGGI